MVSLLELLKRFETKESCLEFLEGLRFPNGVKCPKCSSESISRIKTRQMFQCMSCRYMFSATVGTIFHRTHLPLQKWILASFLICNAKKGISAKQIQRDLKLTYKSSWYLMHRIRRAMKDLNFRAKFTGTIEIDDSYIGGKAKGPRGRGARNKIMVIGALERNGKIVVEIPPNAKSRTIKEFVLKYVDKKAEMLCTDEFPSYNQLAIDYNLERINHQMEYVRGQVHVNGVENFWSILKRGFYGTYHHVSHKYLPLYLNEFTYRFNSRKNGTLYEDVLKNGLSELKG